MLTWTHLHARISAVSWSALLTSYPVTRMSSMTAALIMSHVLSLITPAAFHPMLVSWAMVLLLVHGVGLIGQARLWLIWLVGTFVWQSAMLGLCLWELVELSAH